LKRNLKIYMRGKSVTQLQNMLKQMGFPMEDQPAIFGASTRDGVKSFQKRKGLKTTGVVDDELFTLMQQSVGFQAEAGEKRKVNKSGSSIDQQRLDALIDLLVSKGVISEDELAAALQPPEQTPEQPQNSESVAPQAKKVPGTPLF